MISKLLQQILGELRLGLGGTMESLCAPVYTTYLCQEDPISVRNCSHLLCMSSVVHLIETNSDSSRCINLMAKMPFASCFYQSGLSQSHTVPMLYLHGDCAVSRFWSGYICSGCFPVLPC